jgi:hypothetical protein
MNQTHYANRARMARFYNGLADEQDEFDRELAKALRMERSREAAEKRRRKA